jgi:ABC-type multidrug transport system fused ATPase/permease subunit
MLKNRTFPAAELAFEDVSFAYTTGQPVLRNVRVSLRAGESVALIGPSGAGKTTLLQMIPRFLDPDSGVVRLAGEDLRSYPRPWLREHVALVLQESLLLPTTIAENIGYGRAGATRDEIEAAAAAANAHEFIRRLPQGYDTVVGDGAARLSVGEKQRLNLARAFLKDAPILLLDEPTSALDAESEGLVLASLRRLMKGRTTLMVAHRLATIREVDRIVVLNAGEVMEVGTAAELLAKGGYFSRVNGS